MLRCTAGSCGEWQPEGGQPPVCAKVCPTEPPIKNADFPHAAAKCDRKPGSQTPCTARCDPGYAASGSGQYTCGADAQWTGGSLNCDLTGCADASPLGHNTQCESVDIGGNKCHPACSSGYHKADDSRAAEYTCDQGGRWVSTGDAVKCNEIENRCAIGTIDAEKRVQAKDDGHCDNKVGSVCAPSCEDGTAKVGGVIAPGYRCQADKSWAPGVPQDPLVCKKTCDGEPQDPHAVIREGFKRQQQCIAECAAGHKVAGGGEDYTCGQSADGKAGEWQDGSLECVVACEAGFEPIDMAETNSTIPCSGCDEGTYSTKDMIECKECPAGLLPSANKTICVQKAQPAPSKNPAIGLWDKETHEMRSRT